MVRGKKKPSPPLWGWAEFLLEVRVESGAYRLLNLIGISNLFLATYSISTGFQFPFYAPAFASKNQRSIV